MPNESFSFARIPNDKVTLKLSRDRRYHSVAYHREAHLFMRSSSDSTSSIGKFLNLALNDELVRLLFFLDFDTFFSMPKEEREDIEVPDLFLEMYTTDRPPDSAVVMPMIARSNFNSEVSIIKEFYNELGSSVESALQNVRFVFELLYKANEAYLIGLVQHSVREVSRDKKFKAKARNLTMDDIVKMSEGIFEEKVKPEMEELVKGHVAESRKRGFAVSPQAGVLKHYRVLKLWNIYGEKFESFQDILSKGLGKEVGFEESQDMFIGLAREGVINEVHVQGCCLTKEPRCNNYVEAFNLSYVSRKCEVCGNDSMSWLVFAPIERRILQTWKMNLLPEMIVGAIMSKVPWVNHVFVHEKIRQLHPEETRSHEVDCIVTTTDGKLILIETSSTKSTTSAANSLTGKIKNLREIDYDALFYVAPLQIDDYIPYTEDKAVLFGSRHLMNLPGFIEGCMEKLLKTPIEVTTADIEEDN